MFGGGGPLKNRPIGFEEGLVLKYSCRVNKLNCVLLLIICCFNIKYDI